MILANEVLDFMFRLTQYEKDRVVAVCDHLGGLKYAKSLPRAFTERGAKYFPGSSLG